MKAFSLLVFFPILLNPLSLEAQFQDRVYPFAELTDEMRAQIDLKDGSVEDWLEVIGEPILRPLDFDTPPSFLGYDPSSYDFRIWLAWHDATNHLFVAAEIVDDYHLSEYERTGSYWYSPYDSSVWFYIDGDQSGGKITQYRDGMLDLDILMKQAQLYTAFAGTYNNDSNVYLTDVSSVASWVHLPPYADGGGGITDSQPVISVVEFYVTPFDQLIWDDPEQSLTSDLSTGKAVKFGLSMWDADPGSDPLRPGRIHSVFGPAASWEDKELTFESDNWAHGILLGTDGSADGTPVEGVSWAGIKAALPE